MNITVISIIVLVAYGILFGLGINSLRSKDYIEIK